MGLVVGDSLLVVDATVQGEVEAEGEQSHAATLRHGARFAPGARDGVRLHSAAARTLRHRGWWPRAVHRVQLWQPGERPEMRQEIVEGDAGLAI